MENEEQTGAEQTGAEQTGATQPQTSYSEDHLDVVAIDGVEVKNEVTAGVQSSAGDRVYIPGVGFVEVSHPVKK